MTDRMSMEDHMELSAEVLRRSLDWKHRSLAAALAAVQAELPDIPKTLTAKVKTRDGGQYSYKYADLADVSKAILPLLGQHGLAFTASPTLVDGKLVLAYSLLHEGGEERTGVYPLTGGTAQEFGSSLTYARRYVLGAMTGVAPEGDDDGQGASAVQMRQDDPPPRRERPRAAERARQAVIRPAGQERAPVVEEDYDGTRYAPEPDGPPDGGTKRDGMSYADRAAIVARGGDLTTPEQRLESVETLKDDAAFLDTLPSDATSEPFDHDGTVTTLRDLWTKRLYLTTVTALELSTLKVVWQVANAQRWLRTQYGDLTIGEWIEAVRDKLTTPSSAEVLAALGETEKVAETDPTTRF